MNSDYCIIMTTCASEVARDRIIHLLLSKRLAACVQVSETTSHYTWKGEERADKEYLIRIKAKTSLYPEIETCVANAHEYEVPEIILIPILEANAAYLTWVDEVSK